MYKFIENHWLKVCYLFAICLWIFLAGLCFYIDTRRPDLLDDYDYGNIFNFSGKLASMNLYNDLYPKLSQKSFLDGNTYNKLAHQYLPHLSKSHLIIFNSNPLVATFFIPFSKLTVGQSYCLWQIIQISGFWLITVLLTGFAKNKMLKYFILLSLFLPIQHYLIIGQVTLILTLLPVCIGYWMISKNKFFIAGICFAFIFFKIQLLPIVLLPVTCLFLLGKRKCLYGWLLGCGLIFSTIVLLYGVDLLKLWVHDLYLTDKVYTTSTYIIEPYIIANVPLIISQYIPILYRDVVKYIIYLFALVLSVHCLYISVLVLKKNRGNWQEFMPLIYVTAISITPLVSPHIMVYDLIIFIIAGIIVFDNSSNDMVSHKLKVLSLTTWFSINVYYFFIFYFTGKSTQPMFWGIIIFFAYGQLISLICQYYLNLPLTNLTKLLNYKEILDAENS